jgi:uncharacterized RDD family membrane protein YckC
MKGKIPCSVHANREATTSCALCGQRLCDACAIEHNGIDYCDACAPADAVRTEFDADYERVPVLNPSRVDRATVASRIIAVLIDGALILLAAFAAALLFWLFAGTPDFLITPRYTPSAFYLYRVLIVIGIPTYFAIAIAMSGQTVGKQLTGVIVLEPDGHILSLHRSVVRVLYMFLSALPFGLGFLWAMWDRNQETWHDKLARTTVFQWGEGI